jgi:hypothetical protein
VTTPERAITDPIGLITDLVAAVEPHLGPDRVRRVAVAIAGRRAKSRRVASALAERPEVLLDGRSPAPRAVGGPSVFARAAIPVLASAGEAPQLPAACGAAWW